MAQTTAFKTYDAIGNREDLTDIVSTITLSKTPLFNTLGKTKARGVYHEWQKDSLSTGNANAQIEGSDFVFSIPSTRTRTGNWTQIFEKTAEVSSTQRAVDVAGVADELAYQVEKRMKELATDIEKALITGTGNSGASGTARTLKGFLSWITTNVETGTGTAAAYETETRYNNLLQTVWASGGMPDAAYVNGFQKRQISSFSTPNTRYVDMTNSKKLSNTVSVYQGDFGEQQVYLDPFMDADKVLVIQQDMWKIAVLDPIHKDDVAHVGLADRVAIYGELTLEARNEAASGKATGLLTA
jgi:hypothetical protein